MIILKLLNLCNIIKPQNCHRRGSTICHQEAVQALAEPASCLFDIVVVVVVVVDASDSCPMSSRTAL